MGSIPPTQPLNHRELLPEKQSDERTMTNGSLVVIGAMTPSVVTVLTATFAIPVAEASILSDAMQETNIMMKGRA